MDGGVAGAGPAGELAGGGPRAEDAVLAVDLAEDGCLGLCGLRVGRGAELELERGAEDVFVTEDVNLGGRLGDRGGDCEREEEGGGFEESS